MKLCFIWVDNYKGFSNFSLNLSDDFHFQFDSPSKTLTKKIMNNLFPTFSIRVSVV